MKSIKDIIQQCHQRHEKPLRQRKTSVTPAMYRKERLYTHIVHCAYRYPVMLQDLEQADISFLPIGRAPWGDQYPQGLVKKRFYKHQGKMDWQIKWWSESWGISLNTGIPSERDGARWHDLHFKYDAIRAETEAISECIDALLNIINNPLLILGKTGGLRFSCRVQDYLHPDTETAKLYIYKDTQTAENTYHRDTYLEIFGKNGHTRWDARYEILHGDLLAPPVIDRDVLFAPIDVLREKLHEPASLPSNGKQIITKIPLSLGSENLDLAKDAFLQRGFSYVKKDGNVHYWTQPHGIAGSEDTLLTETEGLIMVCASTPDSELPTQPTPITDVWNDTDILYPKDNAYNLPHAKIKQVRKEKLSPLAIKRSPPVLGLNETSEADDIVQRDVFQIESIFDKGARILGIITGIGPWDKQKEEAYFLNGGAISVNTPNLKYAEGAEKYFQEGNIPSVLYWKTRSHLWENVKNIPVQERMKNPFQHGNVCEDSERCDALEEKGGNPNESICPHCPVYATCQQRGYLAQFEQARNAKVQMMSIPRLFFDPLYTELVEQILKREDHTDRLCVINQQRTHSFFLNCKIPKKTMMQWTTNWQGKALGNFAKTLLSALEIKDKSYADAVRGVRSVIQTFERQEDAIVQQMCQVNIKGKKVERGFVDSHTGNTLAQYAIEFEGGSKAYIPLDDRTADLLRSQGVTIFSESVPSQDEIEIQMSMNQAIELGILKIDDVDNIQHFPYVCRQADWTFWHQLKHFFNHYKYDPDPPISWDDEVLKFRMPPVLHKSVKRLLLVSSVSADEHLHRVFPNEKLQNYWTEPIPWSHGSRVFQVRTGKYPSGAILDYHNLNHVTFSETGRRFLHAIRREIKADDSVIHGIITNRDIARRMDNIAKLQNVSFVNDYQEMNLIETFPEAVDVIWVIGSPKSSINAIWHRSQMLFGNDEEPLSYDYDMMSSSYKDIRLQSVYEEDVTYSLTQIILKAELDRLTDRRIVLIAGVPLPNITNRDETAIFDWEDFEIAGGLEKLPDAINIRERFELERENLTAESSREEVQRVLGCSPRHANRVLHGLRGGNIRRKTYKEQILSLLKNGEKKTAEITATIDGHPEAIQHELSRLVASDEIVRIRRGVYALPES